MTLSTTASRVSYAGDGVTTAFAFPYKFRASANLKVVEVSAAGVETAKTLSTHYTLATVSDGHGGFASATITMLTAPASGATLVIYRAPALTQEIEPESEGDSLYALANGLDLIAMQMQRQENDGLKAPIGAPSGFSATLPALPIDDDVDYMLGVNAARTGFEWREDAAAGPTGATGATGVSAGHFYTWDTGTTNADPGAGKVRANHATLASATALYISETDNLGNALAAIIATWDDSNSTTKGHILIRKVSALATFVEFAMTGSVTDSGAYDGITVSYVAGAGTFSAGDALTVQFTQTGDKGAAGAGSGDMLAANNLSDVASASTARTNLGLAIGTNVQAYSANLTTWAGVTPTANAQTLLGHTFAQMRSDLSLGDVALLAIASAAEFRANTADRALDTDGVWAAAAEVTLTDAATISVDMSTFLNAKVTLGGNRTLGQPSNTKVGQSGFIRIIQDGTGSRTLAYHADWKFAGGTDPVLTTTAGATDLLFYQVIAANFIYATLVKAVA